MGPGIVPRESLGIATEYVGVIASRDLSPLWTLKTRGSETRRVREKRHVLARYVGLAELLLKYYIRATLAAEQNVPRMKDTKNGHDTLAPNSTS